MVDHMYPPSVLLCDMENIVFSVDFQFHTRLFTMTICPSLRDLYELFKKMAPLRANGAFDLQRPNWSIELAKNQS